jgi:hypothetical protein
MTTTTAKATTVTSKREREREREREGECEGEKIPLGLLDSVIDEFPLEQHTSPGAISKVILAHTAMLTNVCADFEMHWGRIKVQPQHQHSKAVLSRRKSYLEAVHELLNAMEALRKMLVNYKRIRNTQLGQMKTHIRNIRTLELNLKLYSVPSHLFETITTRQINDIRAAIAACKQNYVFAAHSITRLVRRTYVDIVRCIGSLQSRDEHDIGLLMEYEKRYLRSGGSDRGSGRSK